MQKKSLLIFAASLLCFFLSACITAEKKVSEKQIRNADIVVEAFLHNGMTIIDDLCKGNKITAAQQMFKTEDGHDCEINHDHHASAEKGHRYTLIVKATPEANGEFSQKTLNLGDNKYFYKVLYSATIEENEVVITKSIATEGSPSRTQETVEKKLLEDIAENTGGKIEGTRIALQ